VLLTERAADLRSHPGQVSFPGGRQEAGDANPVDAALRECQEETGLGPTGVRILGQLPPVPLTVSGHLVTPVLGWLPAGAKGEPEATAEVSRSAWVPVRELVEPANRFLVRHPSGRTGPGFAAGGMFIWGFTALLLDWMLARTRWSEPWPADRIRPLPEFEAAGDGSVT
jgi:8-oxo-dGTP pyrophosphatase MutT (NUDIX family)